MRDADTTVAHLHGGPGEPDKGPDQRLFVDLDICAGSVCRKCVVDCSYFFHSGINNGMISAIELATYALVCRKCEDPHCVKSCPKEALEQMKDADRMLVRHTLRCVSCRSCSHACPYGTVYPELVPRFANNCDYCLDRRDRSAPVCISTCPYGALKLIRGDTELDERTFRVGRCLVVHSTHWSKDKA